MKGLYIVGAGGAAKEIYLLIKRINVLNQLYEFKGFVGIEEESSLIIGKEKFSIFKESFFLENCAENVAIVFGLGTADKLKKIVDFYQNKKNFSFPNLIHPNVEIDESIILGRGNIIATSCILTVDSSIQSFNYINRGVHIGHDCKIGSYNVINPCAVISGGVVIENENLIGTNATILQYLRIGSRNKIGAGAVVNKGVKSDKVVVGVPAKSIRNL